ncbi:hypothetical protein EFS06_12920 [Levilactobacillus brevis]|nr:hypothetical protein [Levilactobacillus brevis]
MVNTILKEADLFCPNSVRINFTIYLINGSRIFHFLIVDQSKIPMYLQLTSTKCFPIKFKLIQKDLLRKLRLRFQPR